MLNDRSIPRISPPELRGHATLAQIQNTPAHFNTVSSYAPTAEAVVEANHEWNFVDCVTGLNVADTGDDGGITASPVNGPTCSADGISLDGNDDHVNLDDWEFGGTRSFEVYIQYDSFTSYSRITDPGGAACDLCPGGTYLPDSRTNTDDHNDIADCINCRNLEYFLPGSAGCSSSDAGKYMDSDAPAEDDGCSWCPSGRYNGNKGGLSLSDCAICGPGRYSVSESSSTSCTYSDEGKYNDEEEQSECSDCGPGRFNPELGSGIETKRKNCVIGKYNPHSVSTACVDCPDGKTAPAPGLGECTPCQAGKFSSAATSW
ncbi:hypothetical protein TrLO_g11914 [Triparma laevis f. longispina]|uniref:Tyrosine-protein kinase ephrin type A/B receptor-like domain-containing protein n=1 Tax=Triparma laevis f. longispina TaxID=1714387 RepID=A0A9W7FQN2_9STRA|nr:hypothetical protein TrLO_g11914 [Triparma laevis f. longispina]